MLQVFQIVGEAIPPTLGTEGPEFRVAEHEEEQAANQKADRPCKARRGPALAQRSFPEKEKTGKDYKEPSQMMVKFTLFLVLVEDGRLRHSTLRLVVHESRHVHALVSGVERICGRGMGWGLRNAQGEQRRQEGASRCKLTGYLSATHCDSFAIKFLPESVTTSNAADWAK